MGPTYMSPFPGWSESLSPIGSLFMYTGLGLVKFIPGTTPLSSPHGNSFFPSTSYLPRLCSSSYHVLGTRTNDYILGDPNNIVDLVPADYVVNQILNSIEQVGFPLFYFSPVVHFSDFSCSGLC